MRSKSVEVLLWIVPLLFLVSCGEEPLLGGFLISDEQEAEIGAGVNDEVLNEYPLFVDPTVTAWVNDLGNRIANTPRSLDERDGVFYSFSVLDSDIVNAFAAPGGYLYLTRGLILEADSEAEVAAVMGHEVSHVAHRHAVAQIERAFAAGLLTELIFPGGGVASDVILFASNFVLSTSYSQAQETDADDLGVELAFYAGYNPWAMVDFFDKLAALSAGSGDFLPDWLSSHPQPEDRAERTAQNISRLPGDVTRDSSDLSWELTGNFAQVQSILQY